MIPPIPVRRTRMKPAARGAPAAGSALIPSQAHRGQRRACHGPAMKRGPEADFFAHDADDVDRVQVMTRLADAASFRG